MKNLGLQGNVIWSTQHSELITWLIKSLKQVEMDSIIMSDEITNHCQVCWTQWYLQCKLKLLVDLQMYMMMQIITDRAFTFLIISCYSLNFPTQTETPCFFPSKEIVKISEEKSTQDSRGGPPRDLHSDHVSRNICIGSPPYSFEVETFSLYLDNMESLPNCFSSSYLARKEHPASQRIQVEDQRLLQDKQQLILAWK